MADGGSLLTLPRRRRMMAAGRQISKEGWTMDRKLKEMLETFYGRKLEDPKPWTPEEAEKVSKQMEEYRENRDTVPAYQDGQEDV